MNGVIFSNARIKCLENDLLSEERLNRMIDSSTLEAAVKILYETNYGGGAVVENPLEFDKILKAETDIVSKFILEIMPEKSGVEILLLKNDYHNMKALIKGKILKLDEFSFMLFSGGTISLEKLKNALNEDDFSALPEPMAKATKKIADSILTSSVSPRLIDTTFDKAFFEDAYLRTKKEGILKEYLNILIDTLNIGAFIRTKRVEGNEKLFEEGFIQNGTLSYEFFKNAFEGTTEVFVEKCRYTPYYTLFNVEEVQKGNLVAFEAAVDNRILKLFKKEKNDMFSVAPIAGYYLAKISEIKQLKLVLTAIKNKVDKQLIRVRLRELYA